VYVKTQRVADIAVGCLVALLGIFVLVSSTWISVAGVHRLSPRTFPYTVGILLVLCGAGLAVKSWSIRGKDFAIAWPDGEGIRLILVSLVGVAGYIALMNPLGLPLATFLYVAFGTWYLKRSKWVTALVIGLITGVLSHYVFIQLLGLSFPAGFLFE
jgi:putative tricarboxylic transport membrane protein